MVGPTRETDDAQDLLLIMGFMGSGAMWWRLLGHVAPRHRVIVLDNRGTGDSSAATGPLTMQELASDAIAALDAAGVERAHVIGSSMGGMIAQHIALDHRDRVCSLVLAYTTAGGHRAAPNQRIPTSAWLQRLYCGR